MITCQLTYSKRDDISSLLTAAVERYGARRGDNFSGSRYRMIARLYFSESSQCVQFQTFVRETPFRSKVRCDVIQCNSGVLSLQPKR